MNGIQGTYICMHIHRDENSIVPKHSGVGGMPVAEKLKRERERTSGGEGKKTPLLPPQKKDPAPMNPLKKILLDLQESKYDMLLAIRLTEEQAYSMS